MAARPVFNEEQLDILHLAAKRAWATKFKAEGKTQEDMALAIGISQQSVSNLLKGTYRPGVKVAREIAILNGSTLEQLIGDFASAAAPAAPPAPPSSKRLVSTVTAEPFANLTICIQFHSATKHWSPWTIAAARAGFFGNADFAPPEWAAKLDLLEKALERARKAS